MLELNAFGPTARETNWSRGRYDASNKNFPLLIVFMTRLSVDIQSAVATLPASNKQQLWMFAAKFKKRAKADDQGSRVICSWCSSSCLLLLKLINLLVIILKNN